MNLRWLVFDYVDPALEIDVRERRKIRAAARRRVVGASAEVHSRGVVPWWPRIIAPMIPATAMGIAFVLFFMKSQKMWWDILWVMALQLLLSWLLLAVVARWTWRPAVWMALRDAGHHVCLHCGYWLRGLDDNVKRCPECGAERKTMQMDQEP
jgi:hypothetical protein